MAECNMKGGPLHDWGAGKVHCLKCKRCGIELPSYVVAEQLTAALMAAMKWAESAERTLVGLGTRCDVPQTWHPTEMRLLDDGKNRSCCDPRFVKRDENGVPIGWTITLNEYQRANLLWLLCDVLGYDRKDGPLRCLQTGDWAGEIPNALRLNEHGEFEESKLASNCTSEWATDQVNSKHAAAIAALEDLASMLNANGVHTGPCIDFGERIRRHLTSLR